MRIYELMNDSMDCKRVYSADGVKLKARHITAIPQGTVTVGTGHCHLSLAFYQDYTLTQKMNVLVCILIQNTRIM